MVRRLVVGIAARPTAGSSRKPSSLRKIGSQLTRTDNSGPSDESPSCRAACGDLPTRQVVIVNEPYPPVQLVTIAATPARGWSSLAVPSACP